MKEEAVEASLSKIHQLPAEIISKIENEAEKQLHTLLIPIRRKLHSIAETMFEEEKTSHVIQEYLTKWNIEYTTGWARNKHGIIHSKKAGRFGVVGHIHGELESSSGDDAKCIILRSDMDALPMTETTNLEFKCPTPQKMHACGHDGHMTMLLGAAKILADLKSEFSGTVRLVFQPAEEGGAGGKRMVEEGVLDIGGKRAMAAFGMHVWPALPFRSIGYCSGAQMAAAHEFTVTLRGSGGHGAMPHLAIDPMVASSAVVQALQTIVSRRLSPLDSGVVSVCFMNAGDSTGFSVIPSDVSFGGTVRALSLDRLLYLREKVEHVVKNTAVVYDCTASIKWGPECYPPTINSELLYEPVKDIINSIPSVEKLVTIDPTMGAEDFSFIAQEIPSAFIFLGQGGGPEDTNKSEEKKDCEGIYSTALHNTNFMLREELLPIGVQLHVSFALSTLAKLNTAADDG